MNPTSVIRGQGKVAHTTPLFMLISSSEIVYLNPNVMLSVRGADPGPTMRSVRRNSAMLSGRSATTSATKKIVSAPATYVGTGNGAASMSRSPYLGHCGRFSGAVARSHALRSTMASTPRRQRAARADRRIPSHTSAARCREHFSGRVSCFHVVPVASAGRPNIEFTCKRTYAPHHFLCKHCNHIKYPRTSDTATAQPRASVVPLRIARAALDSSP